MLKIIAGKSGSGKSYICLNEFLKHIESSDTFFYQECDAFYIVPEQFAVTEEKKLIEKLAKPLFGYEITNFKRFAYRLISSYGGMNNKDVISSSASIMLLSKILLEKESELEYFTDISESTNQISMIMDLINEFNKYDVEPEKMFDLVAKDDILSSTKAKIGDLANILQSYRSELGSSYFDDRTVYKTALDIIEENNTFKGKKIWIDNFTGFTDIEYKFIVLMIKQADVVTITLPTDLEPDLIYEPINNTYTNLCDIAQRLAVPCDTNIISNRYIERSITLNECDDIFSEVDHCAKEIMSLTKQGVSFNDILICVRNVQDYDVLISSVFKKYSIPVHIDTKKAIDNNPLIKFINCTIDVLSGNYQQSDVIDLIKSNMFQIDSYSCENYILKYGLRCRKDFQNCEHDDIKLVFDALNKLDLKLNVCKNISQVTNVVAEYLCENNCKIIIEAKAAEYIKKGMPDIANEYYRTWNIVIDLLDQISLFLGNSKITSKKNLFNRIKLYLRNGFAQHKIGFIPQLPLCVNLISLDRLRTQGKKYLFFLGANEEFLPKKFEDSGLLKDRERDIFTENNIMLADDNKTSCTKEFFFIDTLLNYSVDNLIISYALSSLGGEEMHASQAVINGIKKYNYSFNTISSCRISDIQEDDSYKIELDEDINLMLFAPENMQYNISGIEKYLQCPYRFLVENGFNIDIRENTDMKFSDIGNVMHETISDACKQLDKKDIDSIDISDCEKAICNAFDKIYEKEKYKYILQDIRNKRLIDRIKSFSVSMLNYIYEKAKESKFIPINYEYSYKPVFIDVKYKGIDKIQLGGRIDRMDLFENDGNKYLRVVDYKSSEKSISKSDVAKGIKLQLISYLYAALKEFSEYKPGGSIYFTLNHDLLSSDHEKVYSEKNDTAVYTTKGFVLSEQEVMSASGNKKITKNTISNQEFCDMFEMLENHIKGAFSRVIDGVFTPCPNATKDVNPCKYCNAKSICGIKKSACND